MGFHANLLDKLWGDKSSVFYHDFTMKESRTKAWIPAVKNTFFLGDTTTIFVLGIERGSSREKSTSQFDITMN